MHMRIILEFAKKYKCPGITIFPQNPRYVSNEQPCIKTTGLYDDLLFLPVSSIFPIPYSVSYSRFLVIFFALTSNLSGRNIPHSCFSLNNIFMIYCFSLFTFNLGYCYIWGFLLNVYSWVIFSNPLYQPLLLTCLIFYR